MYVVTLRFAERFDGNRTYEPGDIYPRGGFTPPVGRAEALLDGRRSELNKTGKAYLRVVGEDAPAPTEPKRRGRSAKS